MRLRHWRKRLNERAKVICRESWELSLQLLPALPFPVARKLLPGQENGSSSFRANLLYRRSGIWLP